MKNKFAKRYKGYSSAFDTWINEGVSEEVDEEYTSYWMPEGLSKEGAAEFMAAASAAKRNGDKKFKFGGKEYPVTIKVDIPLKGEQKEGVELNEGGDQIWFKGIGMTFDEFSLIFATMYVPGSRVLPTEVAPDNSKYGSLLKKLSRKDQKWVVSLLKDYMKRGGVVHKDVVKNFVLKEEVELDEAKTPMYPPTIKNLRMIVKDKQNQVFMFKVGKARVDTFTASAIIAVYDGLKKPEHKKKLEDMIKTKEGFLKTQAFAMKMVK